LNTISLVVADESEPLVRTVRRRTVAKTFNGIGRAQVLPMLSGEIIEGQ
jgi:hypothetical protein